MAPNRDEHGEMVPGREGVELAKHLAGSDSRQPCEWNTNEVDASLAEVACKGAARSLMAGAEGGWEGKVVGLNNFRQTNASVRGGLSGCLMPTHAAVASLRVREFNVHIC